MLRIVPLGGLGEVGLNAMVFETEDEAFLVDCGIMFPQAEMLGVDVVLPDFTHLRELGDKARIAYSLEELASVAAELREPALAARIWGAAERLRESMGAPAAADSTLGLRVDAARGALCDDAAFRLAWQSGRALALDDAIALAMGEAGDPG